MHWKISWAIFGLIILLNHVTKGQQDWSDMSIMDIINATEQLSEVGKFRLCMYEWVI